MRNGKPVDGRKIVEEWNAAHPVGTRVVVTWDGGEETEEVTRSPAELLGEHTPVIWLKGISGCRALSRCRAVGDSN